MTASSDKHRKEQVLNKIRFLETQLTSLDHYLPETYDYLMYELDLQRRMLAEIEVTEYFGQLDGNMSGGN